MKIDPSRIEVPKEDIEKIIERYGCSHEEAVKAWLDASQDAAARFEQTLDDSFAEKKETKVPDIPIHTPLEIKEHLDLYVVGQEDYKKRLSIAAAYHFAIVKALRNKEVEKGKVKRFRKKNTIISGPSGSGKTYCAEILGDYLEVPTLIIDSTDYTEAGYVGKSADDMIRELIQLAPGESKNDKAAFIEQNGGIIFIDEIDKKAKDGKMIGHDISREGFQRAVLKLIERKHISVEDPMSPAGQIQELLSQQRGESGPPRTGISTENILFILGGSFQRYPDDLESIVKKRIERGAGRYGEDGAVTVTGFVSNDKKKSDKHYNLYREAGADDYIQFGLIPELVGRAPVRTYVNALSKSDLIRIMTVTEDSVVDQYKFEFKLFDIDLTFSDDSLSWIAEKAENQKTGARALISVFENLLTDFQFELPGTGFNDLRITKEICVTPKDALLEIMARSPFVDFIQKFRRDQGIDIVFTPKAEERLTEQAKERGVQLTSVIEKALAGAPALNYMAWQGVFEVTEEVVDDPAYFDKLYVEWHKKQMENGEHPPPAGEILP